MKRYVKSDMQAGRDPIVNFELLEELFAETEIGWDRRNNQAEEIYCGIESIDDLDEGFVAENNITPEVFEHTRDYLERLIYGARYYSERFRDTYIQLSDNSTILSIDNEHVPDYYYSQLVEDAAETFKEQTGQELYFLGRSGRHVCIEYTLENLRNYEDYQAIQKSLEQSVIEQANAYSE